MATVVDTFTGALAAVASTTADLTADAAVLQGLDDRELLAAQLSAAQSRRRLDACAALLAGEIAHRSRRDLGHDGLAQREGFRTPEALLQHTTGASFREAATIVQVGGMAHEAVVDRPTGPDDTGVTVGESARPWLRAVGTAVAAGVLSVEQARSIRMGLGEPRADETGITVTVEDLSATVEVLVSEAAGLDADRLFKRARGLREDLDEAGITSRERAIHADRSIKRTRRPNGVPRYIIDPDLESAAFWDDLYDTLTSPRRGGPRFVNESDVAWAAGVAADPRSTEQYVHDAITELLRIGTAVDPAKPILGSRVPAVRVLVTADALEKRTGHGRLEGADLPVSIETIERIACTQGTIPIVFDDDGQVLNLGREQRLFSRKQRIALAARDGGCMDPDCDRPASWTEAHHIRHWARDHGDTDIVEGILLCRYHHLLVHNNHWEIVYRDGSYWLIPPPDVDPAQTPRRMRSKSSALHDLTHDAELRRTEGDTTEPDRETG
ncbi:HNH endonuclease signature motif containing protein [Salinibacterium sp. ZJ454]|uniref:HNH endonuclease signature motif containing protein n=1 Tax=Salinibacterium sp. ZJ454 TaxID=2708339 RepID=UPI0014222FB2|nr:HNH endonuclease signature motif containing protein [Salinibacterium sp. ZJ454]